MQYCISFDEKASTFTYITKGKFDVQVEEEAMSALVSHLHWRKGCKVLADHTNAILTHLTYDDAAHIAELAVKLLAKQPPSKIAVLVASSTACGLATFWETIFSCQSLPKTGVFTDPHIAEQFLLTP